MKSSVEAMKDQGAEDPADIFSTSVTPRDQSIAEIARRGHDKFVLTL